MYSKLLALAASAAGMDVTANSVVCDGQGKVTLNYSYTDDRTGVSLQEFKCGGNMLENDGTAIEGQTGDNAMVMTNLYDACGQNNANTDITKFNMADAVITATVQSTSQNQVLSFETVTMTFSCNFQVQYELETAYEVAEKTEAYTFDTTFEVPATAFTLSMGNANMKAADTASLTIAATTNAAAFDWTLLSSAVGLAPVTIKIKQTGETDFVLMNSVGGLNCGAAELNVVKSNTGNRSFTVEYLAFIMNMADTNYTAVVTIHMCVPTDLPTSACKEMQSGCFLM
jgi:hypothetical protein